MSDREAYIAGEVNELLRMYEQYKQLLAKQQSTSSRLAKQRLLGNTDSEDEMRYQKLGAELQKVSDTMTFASPTIWMRYKNEAYQDEAQPIETMHDFRMHCAKPGYICTKRFIFLNEQLKKNNLPALSDESAFSDETLIKGIISRDVLASLEQHKEFMAQWGTYEYNKREGRVAKWENFTP